MTEEASKITALLEGGEARAGVNPFVAGRYAARLAAVQALYQMEITGRGVQAVVREFERHPFGPDLDEDDPPVPVEIKGAPPVAKPDADGTPAPHADADAAAEGAPDPSARAVRRAPAPDLVFFAALVAGVVEAQADVDAAIGRVLARGWRLSRLDATARAILRAGAYEIMRRPDVPAPASIDAYVGLAHDFFDGPEPGFINAALDAIARGRGSAPAPASPETGPDLGAILDPLDAAPHEAPEAPDKWTDAGPEGSGPDGADGET